MFLWLYMTLLQQVLACAMNKQLFAKVCPDSIYPSRPLWWNRPMPKGSQHLENHLHRFIRKNIDSDYRFSVIIPPYLASEYISPSSPLGSRYSVARFPGWHFFQDLERRYPEGPVYIGGRSCRKMICRVNNNALVVFTSCKWSGTFTTFFAMHLW